MKPNDLIGFARNFASIAHADANQTYDGKPYSAHLEAVVEVLMAFGETDKVVLASGYLHDVMEDVGVSRATITDLFGEKVATLVAALTDEPGENRKERKSKTYPKIKATPGAVQLKLADRIANVTNSLKTSNWRMFFMYSKEHAEFERNLRTIGECDDMWNELARLFLVGKSGFEKTKSVLFVSAESF